MAFFDKFRTNVDGLRQAKDYPGLIALLDDNNPRNRADAAHALASLGVPVIPDLLKRLEQARPASRTRMTEALASAGAPSIPLFLALILRAGPALQTSLSRAIAGAGDAFLEVLLPALHHEQAAIRRATVIALRERGKKAIPHIQGMLHDDNRQVRREVADVLAALQWAPDDPGEKAWFYCLREDWAELAKLQGVAVPVLLRALKSRNPGTRSEAARTLGKIRDSRAIPALIGAVKDPRMDVRIRVVEALGETGDDRAKSPLVAALNDPEHQVRMEAAWALGRLGWVPLSEMQKADYLVAKEQWSDLVRMGRPAIPVLIQALAVDYSGVRTGASEALRQLGQPALDLLGAEAASSDPVRRQRAQIALGYIRKHAVEETRSRPVQEESSRYEEELNEGLAIQKRFEKQFGRPNYERTARDAPLPQSPRAGGSAGAPAAPGKPAQPAAAEPQKDANLDDLIKESRQAEAAWARVKEQFGQETSVPASSVTLDQLIPAEFEQAIVDTDDAGEYMPALQSESEEDEVQELEIPVITPAPVEEPDLPDPIPEKTPLERCLEALRSDDENVRAAAIAALQGMGEEALKYLIEALKDPYYGVRIAVVEALGEIGGEDAVEALILTLGDAREDVRIAAVHALGRIGDPNSIRSLIHLFADRYHGVRTAAADAVTTFGRVALEPLGEALDDPVAVARMTAAKAIGAIGAIESIPGLIGCLGDPAPEVRWSVARALAGFGQEAVEPLFMVLKRGQKEMRLAAIDALWEMPGERVGEALLYALNDDDEEVRTKAEAALRKRRVIDVWRTVFDTQIQEVDRVQEKKKKVSAREADARAFKQSGRQEIDTLVAALKDKAWDTQLDAATRLIMMGRPAVDGLIRALRVEDPEIQESAASLLGEMRETAVAPLIDVLNDPDRFVRLVAARNLGKIGTRQAIDALIGALHRESDDEVREVVAEALGYMGSRQAIEPLILALRDRTEGVKIAAARSLGYIGGIQALEPLILALNDVDDRVRYAALEAMKDPDETMRDHLIVALRSGDAQFRAGVARALEAGDWEPATSDELTLYHMARDRWIEVEQIGADALPVLTGALSDTSIEIRTNAVRTISRIGGDRAIAPLIQALQDDALMVRKRAEWALIEMGDEIIPELDLAIEGASPEVCEILQRIAGDIHKKKARDG